MVGKIYINGLIGSIYNDNNEVAEKGVELIDVIQQVKQHPFATSFEVYINSKGGVVDTGFDIHDYLVGLQLPITTIAENICASIATVIFMSGTRRTMAQGTKFMIHSPLGKPNDFMNSEALEGFTEQLKKVEKRILDFYANTTRLESNELKPLLKAETWLDNVQAFDLGFATEQDIYFEDIQAVAYFNTKTNDKMNTEFTKEQQTWLDKKFEFIAGLFKGQVVNLDLQDANGITISFTDLKDGDTPKVGDVATIEGQPAEGEFIMPQLAGMTVKFEKGIVTEISEVEVEVEDPAMATLKAENETLKQQLASATTEKETAMTNLASAEKAFVNFKSEIGSKFQFVDKKETEDTTEVSEVKTRLAKLNKKK